MSVSDDALIERRLDRLEALTDDMQRTVIKLEASQNHLVIAIGELKTSTNRNFDRIISIENKIARSAGALAVVIVALNILAPIFQTWLGLPH